MKTVHFEDSIRRNADRARGSLSHLIDDSQGVVSAKLDQAGDLIQGAFAHLVEESQDLIRGKTLEAAEMLHQVRELAAQSAREAMGQAKDKAEDSYGEWEKFARRRPLATAAIAIGLGLAAGLAVRGRKSKVVTERTTSSGVNGASKAVARRAPSTRKTATVARKKAPQDKPPTVAH